MLFGLRIIYSEVAYEQKKRQNLAYIMILTTERLILRDFVESDWEAVLAYEQNPLYLRYYEWT